MRLLRTVCSVTATTALAATLAVLPARPVSADPAAGAPIGELLTELRSLYRKAGAATDAYNATGERLRAQTARADRIARRLTVARASLSAGRADAGRLARRQYRGSVGVLPPYLRLLLGADPQRALQHTHLLKRAEESQETILRRLDQRTQRLERLSRQAHGAVAAQRSLAADRRQQREAVRSRIHAVESLLGSLDGPQRTRLEQLERNRVNRAQRSLLADGSLDAVRSPSAAGRQALRYALRQLGKPYGWGAQGPSAFDCSGLTSRAWAHAGRPIPRTSQDQWRQLPHVPVRQVRPGDLVVYYSGATHVAIYAGNGRVVHAPRPGERVQIAPLAVNPVLGAVRPDAR